MEIQENRINDRKDTKHLECKQHATKQPKHQRLYLKINRNIYVGLNES